jgi:hypothetical protein
MRGGMGIRAKNNQLEGVGSLRRDLHSVKARTEVAAAPHSGAAAERQRGCPRTGIDICHARLIM